jgi:chromosome partitioning protein
VVLLSWQLTSDCGSATHRTELAVGRVICVANQKGGVGKTTTSVNLSTSLALLKHRVLLIDLDPQGSASSGLGVRDIGDQATTYDVVIGERSVREAAVVTQVEGLQLVPAHRDLVGAEVELVSALAREFRLAEALKAARDSFDLIIIDCPPSLGLLTVNGLTAADVVLIPLQCEYYALEGLSALLDTVELIRERLNPALRVGGIVLTMFDTRNSLSHQVADEVRRHFPELVYTTVIPRNVRLSESPSHGIPVALYDPASKGSQAYMDLAREVVQRGLISPADQSEPVAAAGEDAHERPA